MAFYWFALGLILGIAFSYYVVMVINETIQTEINNDPGGSDFENDYSAS